MFHWDAQPLRSLLFAPGSNRRRLERVGDFGSDVIVLDLEDAVADAEKDAARALVREQLPRYGDGTGVVVRVNGHDTGRLDDDLAAVVAPGLGCVMVPKVERSETLVHVDRLLGELESTRSLAPGSIRVLPIVETACGLVRCEEIALAPTERLVTLVFGLGDYSVDLGLELGPSGEELLYARSRIAVAARAARLRAPIDGPFLDLADDEGLAADSRRSRRHGFGGRVVVHPGQVETVQRAYSELAEDEAERYRRVVAAFEAAEASGDASIQVDGRFVDYPLYERARRMLQGHGEPVAAKRR